MSTLLLYLWYLIHRANRAVIYLMIDPRSMARGTLLLDMLMNVQFLVDLELIRGRRQQKIDDNTKQNNNKRIDYNYQIGDLVKLKVDDPAKLEERFKGPYRINQVFTNGTISMQTKPGIDTRINIRKIEPYRGQL